MSQVNELLEEAQQERVEDEVCFGFHCLVKPKLAPRRLDQPRDPLLDSRVLHFRDGAPHDCDRLLPVLRF